MIGVIHLNLLLEPLEARFQFVELGVERVFFLHPLAQTVGDHLGETVGLVDGDVADAGDVLDGALGGHRTESDHARNMVGSVGLLDVLVGLGKVLEIHVDIRHRDTVGIEETLEQEVVLDRVEIGDLQAIGDDGTRRGAAPGSHEGPHRARCGDVVLHYQEVVREAHAADGLELEVETLGLLVRERLAVALVRTLVAKVAEVSHGRTEISAAVPALLVTTAGVDDVLVFL